MSAKQVLVADFFKDDFPSYAAYDNTRKIASYIDGMKNSQRKIVYTMCNKYPKDFIKSETLANVCAAYTNYLHGAANLGGVIDTLAQAFVGANNYPLLIGNSGGFGTRINPTCAASRYTRVALEGLNSGKKKVSPIKSMLHKDDDEIIGRQFFESEYIEPKFFVPIFPLLFLNGSSGLSTGFSQDIYPRNPEEIITYIKKKLSGTAAPRMSLLPWFKGHTGKVVVNSETNSVESWGVIVRNNTTSYTITELPIGIEYQKYIEFLNKLYENGTIQDYDDDCDTKTEQICFKIKTTRDFTKKHADDRKLMESLKLIKSLPETLNCIDENGRVREFKSVTEILDAYIDIRLKFYQKRKDWLLKKIRSELEKLSSKYLFIKGIVEGTIVVNKKTKDEIVKQLEKNPKIFKIDGNYDYLLALSIHSLTKEKMEELKNQIITKKDEFNTIKNETIEQMWNDDLHELKKVL